VSKSAKRVVLVVAIVLVVFFAAARLRYPGKVAVKLPPESCDAGLWGHVYRPEKLRVIEACTAVEGRVVSVNRDEDGDLHLALEPDDAQVLNLVNALHAGRHLVVEVICEHPPEASRRKASAACTGFTSQVTIPHPGDRVRVTGTYVTDGQMGWTEIHPVTRIEILR
jgi:hypothetical protein